MKLLLRLKEKFTLFKLKWRYSINGKLPSTLEFYRALLLAFGKRPIERLNEYLFHVGSLKIVLSTSDIYELKTSLSLLKQSLNDSRKPLGGDKGSGDVKVHFLRSYLRSGSTMSSDTQKRLLSTCYDLTLDCILTLEECRLEGKDLSDRHEERVITLTTDFADLYYALINFYLES